MFYETIPVESRGKRQPFLEAVNFLHCWATEPPGALGRKLVHPSSSRVGRFLLQPVCWRTAHPGKAPPPRQVAEVPLPRPFGDKGKPAVTEASCSPSQRNPLVTWEYHPLARATPSSLQSWLMIRQPSGPLHTGLCSQRNLVVLSYSYLLVVTHDDDYTRHWTRSSF